jgi:hypothetical protein
LLASWEAESLAVLGVVVMASNLPEPRFGRNASDFIAFYLVALWVLTG